MNPATSQIINNLANEETTTDSQPVTCIRNKDVFGLNTLYSVQYTVQYTVQRLYSDCTRIVPAEESVSPQQWEEPHRHWVQSVVSDWTDILARIVYILSSDTLIYPWQYKTVMRGKNYIFIQAVFLFIIRFRYLEFSPQANKHLKVWAFKGIICANRK